MKVIYSLLFALSFGILSAQVMDRLEEDCNGVQRSIHTQLASGKSLIVTSQGFDCSICVSKASSWGNWASSNQAQVEVWGAMTLTYSNAIPTCSNLNNWVNTHNWANIFTFIDSNEYYFQSGTPRYLVYDPADSSLVYQGGNENQARSQALALSQINLGQAQFQLQDLQFFLRDGALNFRNVPPGKTRVDLYNLTGKKEKSFLLRPDNKVLNINDLPKGIYLMRLSDVKSAVTRKIVIS